VGRAGACYLLEMGKIAPRLATCEATPQAQRKALPGGGIERRADQRGEWAVPKILLVVFATLAQHRVDGVTVAPPGVGVAGPLGMQRPHPGNPAPQRHAGSGELPAEIFEQFRSWSPAQ